MSRVAVLAVLGGVAACACTSAVREGVPLPAVAAAALLAAAAVAYHWRHAVGSQRPAAATPVAPGALPLLGNALQVLPNIHRIHDWVVEQQRGVGASGATFAFSVPFLRTFYCISNPQVLEYVLKTRAHNFVKGAPFRDNFGALLGRGIFVSDGDEWRWQRKLATRIFSVRSFKQYVGEVFSHKADLLLARLAAACPSGAAAAGPDAAAAALGVDPGAPLDVHDLMYRFTLDTFSRIGFGTDPGCLTTRGRIPFAVAFDRAQRTTNARFWVPCWRVLEALDGRGRQLRRDIATVRSFAADIIAVRRKLLERPAAAADGCAAAAAAAAGAAGCKGGEPAGGERPPPSPSASSASSRSDSFVAGPDAAPAGRDQSSAAAAQPASKPAPAPAAEPSKSRASGAAAGEGKAGASFEDSEDGAPRDLLALFMTELGPDGSPLDEETLIDTVLNFIIAGRDTTAQALSWTLFHVLQRPDVEAKLLAEADAVLGAPGAGGDGGEGPKPTYDQIHELKYARAVFLEGLRLHPSVPENAKFAVRPDVLPDGTRVPAGAMMHYSAYGINRLVSFWGDDADEFRPERWAEFAHAPSPYNCPSFHAGLRICLGQRLAELEGVYVLVLMLRRFRLAAVPGQDVRYDLSASMPMRDGFWVTVQPRAAA